MIIRLLYIVYLFYAAKLGFRVLANFQDDVLPEKFHGRRWNYLFKGLSASLLWPLALSSPNGRKLLAQQLRPGTGDDQNG